MKYMLFVFHGGVIVINEFVISKIKALLNNKSGGEKKNVIILSNYYPPSFIGGAELIAHYQAETMLKRNIARVLVFSLDLTKEVSTDQVCFEETDGLSVVRMSASADYFSDTSYNFFHQTVNEVFYELCQLFHPDIVHCHNIIGMSIGVVDIAKQYGAKVCCTFHDNWGFCYRQTALNSKGKLCEDIFSCQECMSAMTANGIHIPIELRRNCLRFVFEKVDAYIFPSRYQKEAYIKAGFDYHRAYVIKNGIDYDFYSKIKTSSSQKFRITTVAHFSIHKGIDTLIRAVGLIGNKDIIINLVGSGEEEENYKKLATALGIQYQLIFWGQIPNRDIAKVYAETDVYCLPSIWPENQPVSITEAMACGLPVIASDLGGNAELVEDEITGLLFSHGDENDLACKIKKLMLDMETRLKMGKAGRERIFDYSFDNQVNEINSLYDLLLKNTFANSGKSSKKIIAFVGNNIPNWMDLFEEYDVLLWEWILDKSDYYKVAACIILPGCKLSDEDMKAIRQNGIMLLVAEEDAGQYATGGFRLEKYSDKVDMIKKALNTANILCLLKR